MGGGVGDRIGGRGRDGQWFSARSRDAGWSCDR